VYGSPLNETAGLRRAVTTVFVGDQTRCDPRPGNSFEQMTQFGGFDLPDMPAGEPVTGSMFPIVH
jgi:hypothetical protein